MIEMRFKTLDWKAGTLWLLDQRALPGRAEMIECRGVMDVFEGIRNMTVRGAPAIGVAAAYGMVLSVSDTTASVGRARSQLEEDGRRLKAARPTAVNLAWAVDRMMARSHNSMITSSWDLRNNLEDEAITIHSEDAEMCRRIGEHGAQFFADGMRVLTHCNAGALATAGIGTALACVYTAQAQGKHLHIYVDETRPVLQGARLTMWELMRQGVDCTLVTDNTAAALFGRGQIDAVIVGADRIARNGDVANKIGTYNVAVLAAHHRVPFYVAAPRSTFDDNVADGSQIPIEERSALEVTDVGKARLAPPNSQVYSPAFDVTPCQLITAIISDESVHPGGRATPSRGWPGSRF